METIIAIAVILIICIIRNIIVNRPSLEKDAMFAEEVASSTDEGVHKSIEEPDNKLEKEVGNGVTPDIRGLMCNALKELGCQPETHDDGSLSVKYQGELFHMEFGGRYCRVWDPMWSGIRTDDPELPHVREVVNYANFEFGPTIVLSEPNKDGVIGFHSCCDIMLHPACPENVPYVKSVLDSFFAAKERVRESFRQLVDKQAEAQRTRRPIGFDTNSITA